MQRSYRPSWWKRALAAPATFWVFVGLIVFFSWIGWGEYQDSRALASTIRKILYDIDDAQKRSGELEVLERNFQEENFQEKMARERFQMKKAGERVGVIVRPDQNRAEIEARRMTPNPSLDQTENAEAWLKLFGAKTEE